MTHPISNTYTLTPQAEEKHTADKLTSAEPESFPHRSEEVDRSLGSATPSTGTQRTGQVDSSPSAEQGGPSKSATEAPPGSDNSSTPSTGKNLSSLPTRHHHRSGTHLRAATNGSHTDTPPTGSSVRSLTMIRPSIPPLLPTYRIRIIPMQSIKTPRTWAASRSPPSSTSTMRSDVKCQMSRCAIRTRTRALCAVVGDGGTVLMRMISTHVPLRSAVWSLLAPLAPFSAQRWRIDWLTTVPTSPP